MGLTLPPLAAGDTPPADDPRLAPLVERVAETSGRSPDQIRAWLNEARIQPDIVAAIREPAEALPWYRYRPIFLNDERIREGAAFWDRHAGTLERAEAEFGVPPAIITAIIGV